MRGKKIFILFGWPHLFKRVKANWSGNFVEWFKAKKDKFQWRGNKFVIRKYAGEWFDIVLLYQHYCLHGDIRFSDDIIFPFSKEKMRVKFMAISPEHDYSQRFESNSRIFAANERSIGMPNFNQHPKELSRIRSFNRILNPALSLTQPVKSQPFLIRQTRRVHR